MPTYNMRCKDCGKLFEVQRSYDDAPNHRCPRCKSRNVKNVVQVPAVSFKGDGFTLARNSDDEE